MNECHLVSILINNQILTEMGKRGDSNSVYCTLAASNHSATEREENDFYATPKIATAALLKKMSENGISIDMNCSIWEPCCGKGHIASVLADEGYSVIAQDLIVRDQISQNYEYIKEPRDLFAQEDCPCTHIITNPPYGMSNEAVIKCLSLLEDGAVMAMLLKIQFLETKKRYQQIFKENPPKWVFIFSNRINCAKGGEFDENDGLGGAACFAWFIWEKGYKGFPTLDWISCD